MKLQEYDINEQRLQAAIENGVGKAMRRRPLRRTSLVLVLGLALSLGTAAAARYLSFIGWDGREIVETQPTPELTAPPDLSAMEAFDAQANALLAEKPDFAYWIVTDGKRGSHGEPSERIPSMAQGAARVRASGMRIWEELPAGYALESLEVWFYFTARDFEETVCTFDESVVPGIMLKQYAPPERIRGQIARYVLELSDGAGLRITLSADLDQSAAPGGFGIQEGTAYESLDIPGMAHALYRSSTEDSRHTLYLLQKDMPPQEFTFFFDFEDPTPETMVYDRVRYSIRADALSRDELIALAEALR